MAPPFGSFSPLCSRAPLPECNLFFSLLLNNPPKSPQGQGNPAIAALFPQSAARAIGINSSSAAGDVIVQDLVSRSGSGLGMHCEVWRVGERKGFAVPSSANAAGPASLGDIAQIILSLLSFFLMAYIIYKTNRRRAAVGRSELRYFFVLYALSLPLQIVTTASVLAQGSTALSVISSIHVALIAGMAWCLLANGIVATQVVEDGTMSSLVPLTFVLVIISGVTAYVALDTAFQFTSLFKPNVAEEPDLRNIALFILGLLWPAAAVVLYLLTMLFVVYVKLREVVPCLWFMLSFVLFAAGQVILIFATQPLCNASKSGLTANFLSTLLNTAAVYVLFLAWKSITEDDWDDDYGWTRESGYEKQPPTSSSYEMKPY